MIEDKILPQTYLFFPKNFPKFLTIQLNEVFSTWLQPVLLRETLRKKDGVGKCHHSSFRKRSGSSCHGKGLQGHSMKYEAFSLELSAVF